MPEYHLEYLTRNEYITSTSTIKDRRTINFAAMSLKWWDKKFGWYQKGCVALCDENTLHLSYIFYKIDRYNNYLTIHNLFTQENQRRNGYAQALLTFIFHIAVAQKVKRFRLTCISNSLDFYLSLGFVYWGVNSVGDFYCDLPLPNEGLVGVIPMIKTFTILELIGKNRAIISKKIANNSSNLTQTQTLKYDSDVVRLNGSYLQEKFLSMKDT